MTLTEAEVRARLAELRAEEATLLALLPVPEVDPTDPRIRMTRQSDGRWIWTREEGAEAVNLGWVGPTKAIVGSHAARLKRPLMEVLAAAIRREYGTDVTVEEKGGIES